MAGELYESKCLLFLKIMMLLLTTIVFSLLITFNKKRFSNLNYFNKLSNHWQRSPIIDITFSNLTNTCEDGLYFFNSSYDIWPGTVNSCLYNQNLYNFSCPDNSPSFTNVMGISKQGYNAWNNRNICFRRSAINYLNAVVIPNTTTCPTNQKKCGYADSLYNILCVSISDQCPINYLNILSINDSIPTDFNYTVLKFDNKKLIYTNQKVDTGFIIADFKVSENFPCSNPSFENKIYSNFSYDNYSMGYQCLSPFVSFSFREFFY